MAAIWRLIAALGSLMIVSLVSGDMCTKAQAQRDNCTKVCNSAGYCVTRCGFGYPMDMTPPPLEPIALTSGRSLVICPVLPPCWRDGQPLDGATGKPLPYEEAQALIKSRTGN